MPGRSPTPCPTTSQTASRCESRHIPCCAPTGSGRIWKSERASRNYGSCVRPPWTTSLAIGMAGLIMEHFVYGRVRTAPRLASEHMALVESIGDPTLTIGLSLGAIATKIQSAEMGRCRAGHSWSLSWPTVTGPAETPLWVRRWWWHWQRGAPPDWHGVVSGGERISRRLLRRPAEPNRGRTPWS